MRVAVPSLAIWLLACFTYTRVETVTPARGAEVVATVTGPLDARVGEVTVHGVTLAEGRVAYADGDSLVLWGRRFVSEAGTEYRGVGDEVTIPRNQIVELRERRVSTWKTALALSAGGAAVAAVIAGVGPLGGSSSGGGPPKPGASVRAP